MPRREQPLEAGDDVLLRFAGALRRLRVQTGNPTYRQLSTRAHYSAAALSEAAGGRRLPSLAVTLAFVSACGGDTASWEARWREAAAETAARNADVPADEVSGEAPYVGLAAFQADDAPRFFGRESLVDDLVTRVRDRRFFGVFGASGSGKSSVLRAGLATRFPAWEIVIFTPGPHPIEECAIQLAGVLGESSAVLRAELAADPSNLHLRVRQAMVKRQPEADLLLVVDQFEELFTLCQTQGEQRWLIDALTTATSAETSRTRVVLGVRADFYGHCGQHPQLVAAIRDAQLLVGPMTADELCLAITEPAARAGCRVETALVTRLVSDASGQPAVLPMVSHALLETWRRRRGTTLTLAGYEAVGGIQHALSRTAEEIYATLDTEQQDIAKRIFLRLTALGDGTEDTKRRIGRHELADDPGTTVVLDRLADARLVTLDRENVELTHEALIRHWPRLRDWLTEDRDGQRIHHDLADATNTWESLHRDPGALYRGARLTRARDWATTRDPAFTTREREFLHTSLSTEAHERNLTHRRRRRSRQLTALLAVLLLVASAATGYAIRTNQTATQQRNAALALSALREASLMRVTNPALAMQLTLAAYRLDPTLSARDAMHETFATPYATRLTGHADTVSGPAISRDGKLLATTTQSEGAIQLVDISNPHNPQELPGLTIHAGSIAFSPRAAILATVGRDLTPRLWSVDDPHNLRELTAGPGKPGDYRVTAIAFSPDGLLLAVAGGVGIQLWNVADPTKPQPVAKFQHFALAVPGEGASVAFGPGGHTIAATTYNHTVLMWQVTNPNRAQVLKIGNREADGVYAVAFNPTGGMLATVGEDAANRLWDLNDPDHPEPLADLTGHTGPVRGVAFSADGNTVATASADRKTRLWDISDRRAPTELAVRGGHTDAVHTVILSPDGHTLVTGSADQTVRLEDISSLALANHTSLVYAVAFSADGRMMASGSGERTIRLWATTDRDHPRLLGTIRPDDTSAGMIFSPDNHFLAITGVQGKAQLWDISNPHDPRQLPTGSIPGMMTISFRSDGRMVGVTQYPTRLWSADGRGDNPVLVGLATGSYLAQAYLVAFRADSRILAVADGDGMMQVWDIADPGHPRPGAILPSKGFPMAFSRDGRLLAIAHLDGTTGLWDLSDLSQPERLSSIAAGTRSDTIRGPGAKMTFSSDGRMLVTASGDETARLWDISDPRHPKEEATLRGHSADVLAVAFHSDGHTVATAGNDHVVRLWETDVERLAGRVCEIAYPRMTKSEWDQYFRGLQYRPPCS